MATVVSLLVNTVNPIADAVSYRSGVPEALGHHAAALSELLRNLLMQPDVHFCRTGEGALVAELLRELFAGAQAAVELEQLHKIHDGFLPIQIFILLLGDFLNHVFNLLMRQRLAG